MLRCNYWVINTRSFVLIFNANIPYFYSFANYLRIFRFFLLNFENFRENCSVDVPYLGLIKLYADVVCQGKQVLNSGSTHILVKV